jgi:hypothetical protein
MGGANLRTCVCRGMHPIFFWKHKLCVITTKLVLEHSSKVQVNLSKMLTINSVHPTQNFCLLHCPQVQLPGSAAREVPNI